MNIIKTAIAGAAIAAAIALPLAGASAAFAVDATFPPTAVADMYTTVQDTTLIVDAASGTLANDSSGGNPDLEMNGATTSPDGNLIWNFDGSFTFIPTPGFVGTFQIGYDDLAGGMYSNFVDFIVIVTAAPAPLPVANPDNYTTPQDTTLLIDAPAGLLANDVSAFQINFQDDATGEVLVNAAGDFTYTPAPGFVGTKTFNYTMTDGTNTSNVALVTIEVTAPITIIPSNPIPHDSTIPGTTDDGQLETLAYTGADDVTAWLIAPAAALLALGGLGVWFARRRSAQQ